MSRSDVIVFGGYGTFGKHIVRELADAGLRITVAGRNRQRAERAAAELGPSHRGIEADLADDTSCRDVVAEHHVAVNAAGPFSMLPSALIDACLAVGCHHVDIADDRPYVARVRKRSEEFKLAGLSAVFGCSSLPGISGALTELLAQDLPQAIDHIRVTMFIGNRNPKGAGAVQSAAATIGRPISAPQGTLVGFGGPERVPLFPPQGTRRALDFNSPDYDLLPDLLGFESLRVKVGFELPGVTAGFGLSARFFPWLGRTLIPRLVPFSGTFSWFGSSAGQIMVEMFADQKLVRRAAVVAPENGQRMAAMPAVHVTRMLCSDSPPPTGAQTAYQAVGGPRLICLLVADGFTFKSDPARSLPADA